MERTFYLKSASKRRLGIGFLLFSILPILVFPLLLPDTNSVLLLQKIGWGNLFFILILQAGIAFLFLPEIPVLALKKDHLLYNPAFFSSSKFDGILFFIAPYAYRSLSDCINYKDVQKMKIESKMTWTQAPNIKFQMNNKSLNYKEIGGAINVLNKEDQGDLISLLQQKIKV